jgi:hypothetical protein
VCPGRRRLDEAFELADRHDVRTTAAASGWSGKLVRSLVERGRKHLDAGRSPKPPPTPTRPAASAA